MISATPHISFPVGVSLFVDKMFRELNLDSIICPLKMRGTNLCSILRGMISYKLTENFSIKRCHVWMNTPEILDYYHLNPFSLKTLYRALETLGDSFGLILNSIQDYLFSHYSFETTDEYLDWTSLILWGDKADLGEYGYSRDHRPDKKQITIGISELAKPVEIPIGMTVRAGNVNDMEHFKTTYLQTSRRLRPGSLIIFDKGANSEENLDLTESTGKKYLTSMRYNKSLDKRFKHFWEDNPECLNPDEMDEMKRIYGIKIIYPKSINYLYFSKEREELDLLAHHRKAVKDLEEARYVKECVYHGRKLPRKYRTSKNKFLKLSCTIQVDLGNESDDELLERYERELKTGREGFFALKSSKNLTLNEAYSQYFSKDSIEKMFHSLKNEIEIKPLRVWTESSIKGALLIGFLAQLFVSLTKYLIPEVKKVATKFFLKSLKNLTLTIIKGESVFRRFIYSNFEWMNMAILRLNQDNILSRAGG
ncbi:MAG: transposase [Prevotellaceae bacterium]|nr:transposase [Prevotellaceae bacterium]